MPSPIRRAKAARPSDTRCVALAPGGSVMKIENIRKLGRDERGLSTVEYTILLVLIVACSVGLWKKLGEDVTDKLSGSRKQVAKVKVVEAK